jgi:hypothetical protein
MGTIGPSPVVVVVPVCVDIKVQGVILFASRSDLKGAFEDSLILKCLIWLRLWAFTLLSL